MKDKINKPRVVREKQNTYTRVVPDKKKYNRKKREVVGYYMDYDGKERILYKDDK